jgi:hypothetical protein
LEKMQMDRKVVLAVLPLCAALMAPLAGADTGEWTGNVNFSLGSKALDQDDWEPVEDQGEFGVSVDFGKKDWPVNIVIALYGSGDESSYQGYDVEGTTSEFRVGVQKAWSPSPNMHPFIGGGIALIGAEYKVEPVSDDDTGTGLWINGGIFWTLGTAFNLGFELGHSQADVTLFGVDGEAGGGHAAIILGYHW